jgi:hypothetical protein
VDQEEPQGPESGEAVVEGFEGFQPPRWAALLAAALLAAGALGMVYYAFTIWGHQGAGQPQGSLGGFAATPTQVEYAESPLVAGYHADSTPMLVFNCNAARTGTWAAAENAGQSPEGGERQDIINDLCEATGRYAFCARQGASASRVQLVRLAKPACEGQDGMAVIYAFHGPSCPSSAAQRAVLDGLESEFPGDLEVRYVCTPLSESDVARCAAGVRAGDYQE